MKAVSVLMPVFNAEKYLKEAIDSILEQTFKDFEFLIINDGSTDNSEEIILSYADERIRYVKNEKNIGLVATLNKGLDLISTEYIVRMDADDISIKQRFEIQKNFMDKHLELGVSSTALERFGSENAVWKTPLGNDEIKSALLFGSSIAHAPCIMRTKLLKENNVRYRDLYPHLEDYDLWLRLKDLTRFGNVPDVLYRYRVAENNVTVLNAGSNRERKMQIFARIFKEMGLVFSEEELNLHLGFRNGLNSPTVQNIVKYKKWLDKIVAANKQTGFFPQSSLEKEVQMRWYGLFFILPEFSYLSTLEYIRLSRNLNWHQFMYFIKFSLNKIFRPGKFKQNEKR